MDITFPLFGTTTATSDSCGLSVEGLETSLNTANPWQLSLPATGVFGLTGPSGSGKSTLLAALAGLRRCRGDITFANTVWQRGRRALATHKRALSLGFQDSRLFAGQSVADNLALARNYSRRPLPAEECEQLLRAFGIAPLLHQPIELLSGGEAQRVALLRQLFHNASLQLFDEPLSAVDRAQVLRCLLPTLRDFWARYPALVIWTSHDFDEIQLLAQRCLWMESAGLSAPLSLGEVARRLDTNTVGDSCRSRIEARVESLQDGLLSLDLGGVFIYADRVTGHYSKGDTAAFLLEAGDISLSVEKPGLSSILNCLPVALIEKQNLTDGRIRLRLIAAEQVFYADISRLSCERLQLREDTTYFAQFKAGSLAGL
ncbi:ATP-binding cassette domain-containing protein [Microbulbifer sp. OS29]|uniref:ATP-binding cassette domain-containing protein n=1 Tax=Microbulbifer okhotskensis TaxID=2926617 RepID=A0A9X2J6F4_9GAMM|nr:ATP-binding cassette domain-containing protein [Microbulbifer okhotskensis]MCO1334560.1 ATP-binding cassette domain-containing protein [Microbulbifer okhotskensis]